MLLSTKHNFVFIKNKKVAGTSLEVFLSNYLEDDAVVTPVSTFNFLDEVRRIENDHEEDWRKDGKSARNYKGSFAEENYLRLRQAQRYLRTYLRVGVLGLGSPLEKKSKVINVKRSFKFYDHMKLSEVQERLPVHVFENLVKAVIIRNPSAQCISDYYDCINRPEAYLFDSFDEYLLLRMPVFFEKIRSKCEIDSVIAITDFLRYENLVDDLQVFADKVGLDINSSGLVDYRIHGSYSANTSSAKLTPGDLSSRQRGLIKEKSGWLSDFYF